MDWFQAQYMPYRRWQARFGDERARLVVIDHAQNFSRWYLQHYPQWLLETGWLSFQHSSQLQSDTSNTLTLCIILDGLPAWDAEDFIRSVSGKVERLTLQQRSYSFAPLPTVTEFSKDALLKGVPPRLALQSPPLGRIIPDNTSPKRGLEEAQIGEVVFWRVSQPDVSYHFESSDKRERQVRAELGSILQALQEVVEELPINIPLRIILTSDHGRLMNAKSLRRLPIPSGMQAHGRVAWGKLNRNFDETGFDIDANSGWIDVFGERFEMVYDMRIAWSEESFKNTKDGYEPYPHGGLFPEEAIVPWFILVRDAKPPDLDVSVSGTGISGEPGVLTVTITNPSPMELECMLVSLSSGAQANVDWRVSPLKQATFSTSLSPWPSKADLSTIKANLLFRQPNGVTFSREVIPSLEVQALYERDDTLLKDLNL